MNKRNFYLIISAIGSGLVSSVIFYGSNSVFAACTTDSETGIISCSESVNASVTIPSACSLTRTSGSGDYSGRLANGSSVIINGSNFKAICNNPNGLAIYAVGFSNNEYGNTDLVASTISNEYNIKTNGESSNWKMEVYDPEASGFTPIIENNFDSWHTVPSALTKIASYYTYTDINNGPEVGINYQVTASTTQPADDYVGQVKYILLHPDSLEPVTIDDAFLMHGKAKILGDDGEYHYKMQDMSAEICNNVTVYDDLSETKLVDIRDNKSYYVTKLADDNCWMTQNLDHNITTVANFYTSENTDIPVSESPLTITNDPRWGQSEPYDYVPRYYDPGDVCWNGNFEPYANVVPCTDANANRHYSLGNYYTWGAAAAINDLRDIELDEKDVGQSICPAGWMLPYGYYGDELSYPNLIDILKIEAGEEGNIQKSPVYFIYSGRLSATDTYYTDLGYNGQYWSNRGKVYDYEQSAYVLRFEKSGDLYTDALYDAGNGLPVRCVAR